MRTIGQVLNSTPSYSGVAVPELPHFGGIGMELELESTRRFGDVDGWVRTSDGSLRDGVEYVFDGPQQGATALASILAMGEYLRAHPADPSFRCSTHIHMDVRDLRMDELERLMIAYCMFEGVMFDHCSAERRYSNFCVPFFVNDSLIRHFAQRYVSTPGPRAKMAALSSWPKYSGFNLKVTPEIGSVEFRGSHALTTSEELLGLAQRMLHLKRLVKDTRGDTPAAFAKALRRMPLGDAFPQGLRRGYTPDSESMDIGYSNAMFIASSEWAYNEGDSSPGEVESVTDLLRGTRDRARAYAHAPSAAADMWVELNQRQWEAYNIDTSVVSAHSGNPSYKRFSDVLKVYRALRSIRGVQPPSLTSLLAPTAREELLRAYPAQAIHSQIASLSINIPDDWI